MITGRPRKNAEEVYSEGITVAVRKAMRERIENVVKAKGISINQFGRESFDINLKRIEKELNI